MLKFFSYQVRWEKSENGNLQSVNRLLLSQHFKATETRACDLNRNEFFHKILISNEILDFVRSLKVLLFIIVTVLGVGDSICIHKISVPCWRLVLKLEFLIHRSKQYENKHSVKKKKKKKVQ